MPQTVVYNNGNGTVNVYNCQCQSPPRNGHGHFNHNDNDSNRDHNANNGNKKDGKYRNMNNTTDVCGGTETEYIYVEQGGIVDIIAEQGTENQFQNLSYRLDVNNEKRDPTKDINNIKYICDDATSRDMFNQDNSKEVILLPELLKNANLEYPKCDSYSIDSKFIDDGGYRKFIDSDGLNISGNDDLVFVYVVVECPIIETLLHEYIRHQTFDQYAGNGQTQELARNGFFHVPNHGPASTMCFFCRMVRDSWRQNDNIEEIHRAESPNCPLYDNVPVHRVEQQQYINAMQTLANGGAERAQIETGEGTSRLVTNEERGNTLIRQQRSPIIDVSTGAVELHPENIYGMLQQPTPVEAIWFYYIGVADLICCFICGGGIRNWNNSVAIVTLVHERYYPNCPQNIQHPRGASTTELQNDLNAITNGNESTRDEAQASGNSPLDTTDYQRIDHQLGELTQAERSEQHRNQQPNAQRVQVRNSSPIHGIGYRYCPYIQHPRGAGVTEIRNDQHAVTNGHVLTRDEAHATGISPLDTTENQSLEHTLGELIQADSSEQHSNPQPNDQRVQDPIERLNSHTRPIQNDDNERTRPVYSLSTTNAGLSNRPSRTIVPNTPELHAGQGYDVESEINEASTEVEDPRSTNISVRNGINILQSLVQEDNNQVQDAHSICRLCRIMPAEEACQTCGHLVLCNNCFATTVYCYKCKRRRDEVT